MFFSGCNRLPRQHVVALLRAFGGVLCCDPADNTFSDRHCDMPAAVIIMTSCRTTQLRLSIWHLVTGWGWLRSSSIIPQLLLLSTLHVTPQDWTARVQAKGVGIGHYALKERAHGSMTCKSDMFFLLNTKHICSWRPLVVQHWKVGLWHVL